MTSGFRNSRATKDTFRLRSHSSRASALLGPDLRGTLLALSPAFLYMLDDANGATSCVNAAGGAVATPTSIDLGSPAIYSNGGTCGTFSAGSDVLEIPASVQSTGTTAMTLFAVIKPSSISSFNMLLTRDPGSGNRKFQYRIESGGTGQVSIIKIVGSVQTVSTVTGIAVAGQACCLGVTVDAAGNVAHYKNGSAVALSTGSTVTGGQDYGDPGVPITFGASIGASAGFLGDACALAGFNSALTAAQMLAIAQAAGFA